MSCYFESLTIPSARDDLPLSILIAVPSGPIRGIVQFAHDMAEHKERYKPFMSYLCDHGYVCIINDHRGHGKSVRKKQDLGYLYEGRANALVQDMYQVTHIAKKRWPDVPFCLFGQGMGALAARIYAKFYDRQLDALILCGTLSYYEKTQKTTRLIRITQRLKSDRYKSEFFHTRLFGKFNHRFPREKGAFVWLNSVKEAVDDYIKDPLCGFVFTLNGYLSLMDMMEAAYSPQGWAMKNIFLPIRFISGEDDPCMINLNRLQEAVESMRDIGYEDASFSVYSGMRHELLHEFDRQLVYDDITDWLNKAVRN